MKRWIESFAAGEEIFKRKVFVMKMKMMMMMMMMMMMCVAREMDTDDDDDLVRRNRSRALNVDGRGNNVRENKRRRKVLEKGTTDDDEPTYHTIFSTECNTYFDWQSLGLYYSFKKVQQKGEFTRLMACNEEPAPGVDIVPNTHVHPNYARNPVTGDRYSAYNKPFSIMHWMEHKKPKEDYIIVLDADMAFRKSMTAELLGVALGNPVSAHYGYLIGVFPKNHMGVKKRVPNVELAQQVGGFTVMHRKDLEPLAPRWLYWTEQVRNDPDSWANTGDVFNSNGKSGPPWISEMYGYVFAAAEQKLRFTVSDSFMLYPGYMPPRDERFPVVLHYGVTYRIDDYAFDKHWYQGTDMTSCTHGKMFEKPIKIEELTSIEGTMMRKRDEVALIVAETLYNSTKERFIDVCKRTDIDFDQPRQRYDCSLKENNILRCKPATKEEIDKIKSKQMAEDMLRGDGSGSCKDNNNQCCAWASSGECTNNPNYMSIECQLSCNLCPNTECATDCCPVDEDSKKKAIATKQPVNKKNIMKAIIGHKKQSNDDDSSSTSSSSSKKNDNGEYDYDVAVAADDTTAAEDEKELREEELEIEEETRKQIEEAEMIIEMEGLRVSNGSSGLGGLEFVGVVALVFAFIARKLNIGGHTKQLSAEQLEAYKLANFETNERLKGRRE